MLQIQPLNRKQVRVFAAARGAHAAEDFIEAIDRQFAWEFARRPIDVVDLLNYWKSNKRLGSLSELLDFSVERKLRPAERDVTDPLSPARAREGANALAAASILGRQLNFSVPDAAALIDNALEVRACLPVDWKSEEIRSLLLRPIFDAASYGRIRFHHRRVGEYLAAEWLATRMANACPTAELEHILFGGSSAPIVRPTLAPVAAWLCLGNQPWNEIVREWIATRSPHIHLQHGDAQALPIEYTRRILTEIVRKATGRNRVWLESSPESLTRLARPELASDFSHVIQDRSIAQDIRTEILQAVEHGGVRDCIPSALAVIRSNDESETLKVYAAAVIRRLGDNESRRELAATASAWDSVPNTLLGIICQAIYPAVVDTGALVELLRKARSIKRFGIDLPYYLTSHLEAKLSSEDAAAFLAKLLKLIQTPPYIDERPGEISISREFSWIIKLLPTVLQVLLRTSVPSAIDTENAATALRLLGHMVNYGQITFLDDEKIKQLDAATKKHSPVRQRYAWQRIEYHRQRKAGLEFFHLSDHHALLQFGSTDLDWLINDIVNRDNSDDRALALRYAMHFSSLSSDARQERRRIRRAIGVDSNLWSVYRRMRRDQLALPLRRFIFWRLNNTVGSRWWWLMKFQAARAKVQHFRDQCRLLFEIPNIRSGRAILWLGHLIREADEQNSTRWAADSWDDLKKKRGRRIADATRAGCKKVWRTFAPQLPHEKSHPGQTDIRVPIGLTGIQAEIEDEELDFRSISRNDVLVAARYAVDELNGFPSWFHDLADAQPDAVRSVLTECVTGEWKFPSDRERTHEVMNKLVWQGQRLNRLVDEHVIKLLRISEPENLTILRFSVSIVLQANCQSTNDLLDIALRRFESLDADAKSFALWMAVLLQLDANRGLAILESKLPTAAKPKDLMIDIAALLSPRGSDEKILMENPAYLGASSLRRLIPLVYQYVPPQEDLDRNGTSYTPGARDYAQEFRGDLIPRLASNNSGEAQTALKELLNEPALTQNRDWILHLIDKQEMSAADLPPWTPADVREFAVEHEIDPKTDRDLFRIACKRFIELKHAVEVSENSLRDELRVGDPEIKLRRWLARKLNDRSRRRYTVPEEAVIDLEQRPDLRIQNPNTQTVSVEVKWADDRSTNDLLERLENQVFGQYLRAATSEYAIYVIAVAKYRQWQLPAGEGLIDFNDLIELLRKRADELVKARDDVAGVAVFGINFQQPK